MTNPYDKNKAISADEAAKIIPRAEFRVFGKNIIAGVQGAYVEMQSDPLRSSRNAGRDLFPLSTHQRSQC